MKSLPKRMKEGIENYSEPVDILTSFFATAVLMFISFVGYSRLTTTIIHIPMGIGRDAIVHITYYGFPFSMIGILTPVGGQQTTDALWYMMLGNSNVQILWAGLFINFAFFFLLSFSAIYAYRRFIRR